MKLPAVLTLLALLVAASPAEGASSDCWWNVPNEGIALAGGLYWYTGSTLGKRGLWQETNGTNGLQTEDCVVGSTTFYVADTRPDLLA